MIFSLPLKVIVGSTIITAGAGVIGWQTVRVERVGEGRVKASI